MKKSPWNSLSIIASSWVEKDIHGDVVEDKMGSWDERVMMVGSSFGFRLRNIMLT